VYKLAEGKKNIRGGGGKEEKAEKKERRM
jgi:hypothetical protein